MTEALGIDIGGTGIKAGLVDTSKGEVVSEIRYDETPAGVDPQWMSEQLADIIQQFDWTGPVGIGFPGVIINDRIYMAVHLSDLWINADARKAFSEAFANRFVILNDADAAGLAEMQFGAGRSMNHDRAGTVLLLTFGTGIGSALFNGGRLIPNTELGHMLVGHESAEDQASGKLKTTLGLNWAQWGERVGGVLKEYEKLFSPELFIIGGGISENFDKFSGLLTTRAEIRPALLKNNAGLVGAALAATQMRS